MNFFLTLDPIRSFDRCRKQHLFLHCAQHLSPWGKRDLCCLSQRVCWKTRKTLKTRKLCKSFFFNFLINSDKKLKFKQSYLFRNQKTLTGILIFITYSRRVLVRPSWSMVKSIIDLKRRLTLANSKKIKFYFSILF